MAKITGGIREKRRASSKSRSVITPEEINLIKNDERFKYDFVDSEQNKHYANVLEAIRNGKELGLSKDELDLVLSYTNHMYKPLNKGLYGTNDPAGILKIARDRTNDILDKLPEYKGIVYHGQTANYAYKLLQDLKNNKTVTTPAFISATYDSEIPKSFTSGLNDQWIFRIKSKTGRSMGKVSFYGNRESEVVFKAGTKFRFVSDRRFKNREWPNSYLRVISIEEV